MKMEIDIANASEENIDKLHQVKRSLTLMFNMGIILSMVGLASILAIAINDGDELWKRLGIAIPTALFVMSMLLAVMMQQEKSMQTMDIQINFWQTMKEHFAPEGEE